MKNLVLVLVFTSSFHYSFSIKMFSLLDVLFQLFLSNKRIENKNIFKHFVLSGTWTTTWRWQKSSWQWCQYRCETIRQNVNLFGCSLGSLSSPYPDELTLLLSCLSFQSHSLASWYYYARLTTKKLKLNWITIKIFNKKTNIIIFRHYYVITFNHTTLMTSPIRN